MCIEEAGKDVRRHTCARAICACVQIIIAGISFCGNVWNLTSWQWLDTRLTLANADDFLLRGISLFAEIFTSVVSELLKHAVQSHLRVGAIGI